MWLIYAGGDADICLPCWTQVLLDLHRIKWRNARKRGEDSKSAKERVADFKARVGYYWAKVFNFKKLKGIPVPKVTRKDPSKGKQFSFYMETDGVGCSFVCKKPKRPHPKRYTPMDVPMNDSTVFLAADPGLGWIATLVALVLQWGEGGATMADASEMPRFGDDRGRVLRMSGAEWHDKAYHNAARRQCEKLLDAAEKRGINIRALQASIPSGKTSRAEVFLKHARAAMERFGVLYKHYKQERAIRWRTYRSEQKALHELCMRVQGGRRKEDVVVAFGAAQFPSTMRGVCSVPVKRFRRYLERYVTLVLTSEWRTSRVCSKGCGWHVDPATREQWDKMKEESDLTHMHHERRACGCAGDRVHATLICPKCRVIWNRDVNAARNIAYMFWWQRVHAGAKPPRFCRPSAATAKRQDSDAGGLSADERKPTEEAFINPSHP